MIDKIWFNTNLVLLDQGVCTPFLKHKNYFKCIEMSKCLLDYTQVLLPLCPSSLCIKQGEK